MDIWGVLEQTGGAWHRPGKSEHLWDETGDAKIRPDWTWVTEGGTGRDRCGMPGKACGRCGNGWGEARAGRLGTGWSQADMGMLGRGQVRLISTWDRPGLSQERLEETWTWLLRRRRREQAETDEGTPGPGDTD